MVQVYVFLWGSFPVFHVDQGVSSCTFSFQSHFGYSYIDPILKSEGGPCQYWLKSGVLVSYSKLWESIRPFGIVLSYSSGDPCRSVLCYIFLTPDSYIYIFFIFLFSLTSLSRLFHSYRDEPICRWGETEVPRENHLIHP